MLLKVGRHIRPRPGFKLVVGREDGENRFLQGYRRQFTSLQVSDGRGPLALVDGVVTDDDLTLAARVVARFGPWREAPRVPIEVAVPGQPARVLEVEPLAADGIPGEWYV